MSLTLTDSQWKAVVANLRFAETAYPEKLYEIEELIAEIQRANGVRTYTVWVRYRDANSPHPRAGVDNPSAWPPTLTFSLTTETPVTKETVEAEVAKRTSRPAGIWATRDPAGSVGWKKIEDWT